MLKKVVFPSKSVPSACCSLTRVSHSQHVTLFPITASDQLPQCKTTNPLLLCSFPVLLQLQLDPGHRILVAKGIFSGKSRVFICSPDSRCGTLSKNRDQSLSLPSNTPWPSARPHPTLQTPLKHIRLCCLKAALGYRFLVCLLFTKS